MALDDWPAPSTVSRVGHSSLGAQLLEVSMPQPDRLADLDNAFHTLRAQQATLALQLEVLNASMHCLDTAILDLNRLWLIRLVRWLTRTLNRLIWFLRG